MDITVNNNNWNIDYTGFFGDKPYEVIEGADIILSFKGMTAGEMVKSREFQMLEKAGFEVHRDWRDLHTKDKGGWKDGLI